MTDEQLSEKYLGKIIEVPFKHPMHFGGTKNTIKGKCEYIGHRPLLPEWELVVTIGRMPITNVDFNQIKIIEDV